MLNFRKTMQMPSADEALPGRSTPIPTASHHFITGRPLKGPTPQGMKEALFGLGCFWGAERQFWQAPGVYLTAAGYSAGFTPNPTYEETCTGRTGHNEVVRVIYDPEKTDYAALLKLFFESHDPTQGMRQGNDIGTTYRSGIYYFDDEQKNAAIAARDAYQTILSKAGFGKITTEIEPAAPFYFAEEYHQQYLAKNPNGYCGLGGTGLACPVGLHTATG
jgi:peptide-methionine (S)-S-oxide reductase